MDVVYILGSGSLSNNDEIRYSLRALEVAMLDLRNVFVIGECPDFLQNIIHVPANDSAKEKHVNAYKKTLLACSLENLSEEFLLMNDDFFMLDPFMGAEWPFYALKGSNGGPCGLHSFHVHAPIRFKKEWYQKMPVDTSFKSCKSLRTFYANFYKAPPKFCDDFVIRAGVGCADFDTQIKNKPCFSISDSSMLYVPFQKWLELQFPHPSCFEKLL